LVICPTLNRSSNYILRQMRRNIIQIIIHSSTIEWVIANQTLCHNLNEPSTHNCVVFEQKLYAIPVWHLISCSDWASIHCHIYITDILWIFANHIQAIFVNVHRRWYSMIRDCWASIGKLLYMYEIILFEHKFYQ